MSPPNVPPVDPTPPGTSPDKGLPPKLPPVAIPATGEPAPESVPIAWWRRQRTAPPSTAPAAGEPESGGPPQMAPGVRLSARPPAELAAAAAPPPPSRPPVVALRSLLRTWVVRVIMIGICLGSAGLVYWSLILRLQPVTRQREDSFARMSRLSDEVEQLRRKWNPAEAEATRARHRAARGLLFAGPAEVQQWQKEAVRDSQSLMLETAFGAGPRERRALGGLDVEAVRSELYIRPAVPVGVTNSPYKQVLGFIQSVVRSPKRVDLLELAVEGNSNSVAQARARLHCLALASATNAPRPASTGGANP